MASFLRRCFYRPGRYDAPDDFRALDLAMKEKEAEASRRGGGGG